MPLSALSKLKAQVNNGTDAKTSETAGLLKDATIEDPLCCRIKTLETLSPLLGIPLDQIKNLSAEQQQTLIETLQPVIDEYVQTNKEVISLEDPPQALLSILDNKIQEFAVDNGITIESKSATHDLSNAVHNGAEPVQAVSDVQASERSNPHTSTESVVMEPTLAASRESSNGIEQDTNLKSDQLTHLLDKEQALSESNTINVEKLRVSNNQQNEVAKLHDEGREPQMLKTDEAKTSEYKKATPISEQISIERTAEKNVLADLHEDTSLIQRKSPINLALSETDSQFVETQTPKQNINEPNSVALSQQTAAKDSPIETTNPAATKIENLGKEVNEQLQVNKTTERSLEVREQIARELLNGLIKTNENPLSKNIRTLSAPLELSKKIQVSTHPVDKEVTKLKTQNGAIQRQEQMTIRNANRLASTLNTRDISRLAELLRTSRQLADRNAKPQTEILAKRLEQLSKIIDTNRYNDRSLSEKQLTRIVLRELLNTLGRQETFKLLRAFRQSQIAMDDLRAQRNLKQMQPSAVIEQVSRQIANRVAVSATQKDINRLAVMLRTNEALTKKFGIETIQNLSKRLEQLTQDPTKLDRQKFKELVKEIRETLGKDGDKLIKQLYREMQLRNNLNDKSMQARQIEVQISADRTERILSAMRLNNPQMMSLPIDLQRLIAVYLMQQLAQYRTAQDLIAMVEEVNAEWAAMLKEKDIEMLLRAGIEVADSDAANTRRKRRVVSRTIVQDISDKRRVSGNSKKQGATEVMTSTSKNAAKIGQNVKAETSSPVAELIISRVKSDDKKPLESD